MPVMTPEVSAILRRHFPPEQVGKLPRKGIQLDYVGHADVTDRLLEADPNWSWVPLARDVDMPQLMVNYSGFPEVIRMIINNSPPRFDLDDRGNPVGLWIKLTVCGVTRLGYGSCPSDQNDAVKVLIGDALRNAAMRFGVALDLWCKGDRQDPTMENPSGPAAHVFRTRKTPQNAPQPTEKPFSARPRSPGTPIKVSPQERAEAVDACETVESLRELWKSIQSAGQLGEKIAIPFTGEQVTLQDFLYKKSDQFTLPKSDTTSEGNPWGNGDKN